MRFINRHTLRLMDRHPVAMGNLIVPVLVELDNIPIIELDFNFSIVSVNDSTQRSIPNA